MGYSVRKESVVSGTLNSELVIFCPNKGDDNAYLDEAIQEASLRYSRVQCVCFLFLNRSLFEPIVTIKTSPQSGKLRLTAIVVSSFLRGKLATTKGSKNATLSPLITPDQLNFVYPVL